MVSAVGGAEGHVTSKDRKKSTIPTSSTRRSAACFVERRDIFTGPKGNNHYCPKVEDSAAAEDSGDLLTDPRQNEIAPELRVDC